MLTGTGAWMVPSSRANHSLPGMPVRPGGSEPEPRVLPFQVPRSIGLIADSLFTPSGDELEVVYGLIAETAEYPEDKSWVVFNLRP